MKKILVLFSMLFATLSFSSENAEIEDKALSFILKTNPIVKENGEDTIKTTLVVLIAPWLTTNINPDTNEGSLNTLSNKCETSKKGYVCSLVIQSKDMLYTEEGSYIPTENSTESTLMIKYEVDKNIKTVIGVVSYFIAG